MRYKTPAALEMAAKAAARQSALDTGRAMTGFYFHRLLCRIFSDPHHAFVLKGGQSMLARTVDARATKDIDLLYREQSLDRALEKLDRLASADLGDHMRFTLTSADPIKVEDEYRSGLHIVFQPALGPKSLQPISIDLVIDEVPLERAELISPADRIEVEGLQVCDYPVYTVENALADKLCALVERHDGRASSRVKDLVDIAVYAVTCAIDGGQLQEHVLREGAVRSIALPETFGIPDEWGAPHERQFEKLCSQTGLPRSLRSIGASVELASRLFDPVLAGSADGVTWNPQKTAWEEQSRHGKQ
ncbi:MAG: nucleotidyl transferase AbiEii/AbiGii toxin family protein [Atopobiaceae bacterium]|nr:nucleotidyl transferase AbiEii/AbiGii toxin family protein [Atopobiaceae bacterium]